MNNTTRSTIAMSCALFVLLGAGAWTTRQDAAPRSPGDLVLREAQERSTGRVVKVGTYTVWENRDRKAGRTIDLDLLIIPARSATPQPDPVFYLVGGPGQAAVSVFREFISHWIAEDRDIVFVSQRGTGQSNGLYCRLSKPPRAGDADGQQPDDDRAVMLGRMFNIEAVQQAREALSRRADLTQYTTPIAMDDLNDVRQALGYEKINLYGGSYGTRAAMVYLRRHGDTVRSAILTGVAPVNFINPLYHASEAQKALDRIFADCAADPACSEAYPNLEGAFDAVLQRLDADPVFVDAIHPETSEAARVYMDRDGFTRSLRLQMYYGHSDVPWMIHQLFLGEYEAFVERSLSRASGISNSLALGMLLCVTCSEDVARIEPGQIARLTDGTFLGSTRVIEQVEACKHWPRGAVSETYGESVVTDVPVLLLSGIYDPVTGPDWGDEAARHMSRGRHIIAPGSHGVSGPCIDHIMQQFLDAGAAEEIDASCVERMRPRPFRLQ